MQLLRLLARHRDESVPAPWKPAAITAWVARWSGLLAVARAEALSDGDLHDVVADAHAD